MIACAEFSVVSPASTFRVPCASSPNSFVCSWLAFLRIGSVICCLSALRQVVPLYLPSSGDGHFCSLCVVWSTLNSFSFMRCGEGLERYQEKCLCSTQPGLSRNHLSKFVLICSSCNNNTINWVAHKQCMFFMVQ